VVTDVIEGKNQLKVLSSIASFQLKDEAPRQADITDTITLTKGAVSNNCKKLEKQDIITERKSKYEIREEKLLKLYKEHLDNYLTRSKSRKDIEDKIKALNEIRTKTKSNLEQITNSETGEMLKELIINVLSRSNKDGNLNTLKDVFHRVDQSVVKLGEISIKSENLNEETKENLMLLAASIDKTYETIPKINGIKEEISKVETNTDKITKKLNEVL